VSDHHCVCRPEPRAIYHRHTLAPQATMHAYARFQAAAWRGVPLRLTRVSRAARRR
jgi:hypothetical protein